MSFGQLKTMGGNFVSRLGGFGDDPNELLTQQQIQQLTPEQLTAYNQQRSMAQQLGTRELAARLSDAFAGRDIVGRAKTRRNDMLERQQKMQDKLLDKQISDAISAGDSDKAYELLAMRNPSMVAQQFLQGRVTQKDLQPQVSADGTMITYFDMDPETGQITPRVEVNKDVVAAQREIELAELEKKPLPNSAIEKELDNEATINSFNYQNNLIDNFIAQIDADMLQFGPGEGIQDFFGKMGFAGIGGEESQQRLSNKTAFERWKESYVNTILQNAKGPQTDGDARRAMNQLAYAQTPEDVKKALQGVKEANMNEIAFNKQTINTRRENFNKSPVYSSDETKVKFKIINDGS